MALQLSFDDRFGATHASAYHKISRIFMDVDSDKAEVLIETYIDLAARTADKKPLSEKAYQLSGADYTSLFSPSSMNPLDKNPIANAYDHLKTLPEWAAASDV